MDSRKPPQDPDHLLDDLESIHDLLGEPDGEPPLLTESFEPDNIPLLSDVVQASPRPAPAEEEGFLASLTESPYLLPGVGALVLAALGGLFFWRKRQGGRKFSGETSFMESKIQPDSFFGASGGQRVDTRDGGNSSSASSSLNYSLSQLDAIGDVDPVAEADVYLAYGRDLQAEEILKEAQRSDPDRLAIRTKLLEVYAKRADLKTFEAQARQLQSLTSGRGEDWQKAQELGRQIDPTNPLYQQGSEISMADTEPAPLTPLAPAHDDADATMIRPPARAAEPPAGQADFSSTDLPIEFDLDAGPAESFEPTAEAPMSFAPSAPAPMAPEPAPAPAFEETPFEVSDFDLSTEPAPAAHAPAAHSHDLDVPAAAPPAIDFDFGDLSLDLEKPATETATAELPELDLPGPESDNEPMARKIELADEFRRIGDHEGARELLEEVVSKADGNLKARAQTMLDALG